MAAVVGSTVVDDAPVVVANGAVVVARPPLFLPPPPHPTKTTNADAQAAAMSRWSLIGARESARTVTNVFEVMGQYPS
jgi:hypothetical protein